MPKKIKMIPHRLNLAWPGDTELSDHPDGTPRSTYAPYRSAARRRPVFEGRIFPALPNFLNEN